MGRYITGDINRKLWFGVQSSAAADRFGNEGEYDEEYGEFNYYFTEEDIPEIEAELQSIIDDIGLFELTKLQEFFRTSNGYNDAILKSAGVFDLWQLHKSDYADYELGKDILECIKRTGECSFTAET